LDDGQKDFDFFGSTITIEQAIRLTSPDKNKEGYLWLNRSNEFEEWEVQFSINISGSGKRGGFKFFFFF
jgi:hypothetical protein